MLGIDIVIRLHHRATIENHSMARCLRLVECSSLDEAVIARAQCAATPKKCVLLVPDFIHTHDHVLSGIQVPRGLNLPSSLRLTVEEAGFVCTTLLELLTHA